MMALVQYLLSEVKGLPLSLEDGTDLREIGARRSMAQVLQLEHMTQEHLINSNSTAISVIYKSDSIFEEAAARKAVVQDYLKEYMPKQDADMSQCDILLSSSEFTVDSRGRYCNLMDVDPDTSCCMDQSVINMTNHNSQCLSTANFTN